MADKSDIPSYNLPESELHFLASEHQLYDYQNLYSYSAWLKKKLDSFYFDTSHPLMLFCDPCDQQVFTIAACWLLGIPVFPVSSGITDPELDQVMQSIEPALVVTDQQNRDRLPELETILIPADRLKMSKIISHKDFKPIDPDHLFAYVLTSGSTSTPKIVPVKRRQALYAAQSSEENFRPDRNRYWLLCLPLNHVGGLSIILRSLFYHTAVFRMDSFDVEQVRTFLSENRLFQVASLVPTMMKRLLLDPGFRVHLDLKAILLGGGPISPSLVKTCIERGMPIVSSFGMTETFAQIAANPLLKPSAAYLPKKSVGRVFEPNQSEIRNDHWESVPANEPGTIWLKGPQIFDGYFDNNQNTGRFDSNGWFNTGDYGYMNRSGHLFIESRRSDLILSGGENINPSEVEAAIEESDSIEQAAVIGVEDEEWGQVVIAYLVPFDPDETVSEEEIKSFLKKRLSSYKIPKKFIQANQLPRTESGKINKRAILRDYNQKHVI